MAWLPPDNAIAYSQFMLRGGWRKTVPLLAGFTVIVGAAILLSVQFQPIYRQETLFGWTTGLLALQGAILVLYGCGRTTASVRQDFTNRMIESHRLMPLPPAHAIAGYIMGSVSQGAMLSGITFLFGTITAAGGGVSFERWAMSNLILVTFSMFLWCVSCFTGFLPKGAGGIIWLVMAAPIFGEGAALGLLPGLAVLLSPVSGPSIFTMRGSYQLPWTYALSLAVQVYVAGVCCAGAMRKYARPEVNALGVKLGMLLLLGWSVVSWVGIRQWEEIKPAWLPKISVENGQIIASILAGILIAIAPVSASAAQALRWRRHVRSKDPAPMRRPVPGGLIVLASTALVTVIGAARWLKTDWQVEALVRTAVVVGASLLGVFFLCRWLYRAGVRAAWFVGMWLFLTWLVPLIVDLVRYAFSDEPANASAVSWIGGCSVVGAICLSWMEELGKTNVGLGVQVVMAFVPLLLDWGTRRSRKTNTELRTSNSAHRMGEMAS